MTMRVLLVLALALAAHAAEASAQRTPAEADAVARDAIGRLRSPYCPGLMLEVCPSPQAEMLRDSIRLLAVEGKEADDIVEWTLARHGEEWRAIPKRSGTGLWAWLAPPAVLLIGVGVVVSRMRSMRRREGPYVPAEPGTLSDEDRARLAEAMAEWEKGRDS